MAKPSSLEATRYYGPQIENTKLNFRNLYLHQRYDQPNPNQEVVFKGSNPPAEFGKTAVNNWEIYEGTSPEAKLVARTQGMHMNAGNWYNSFIMVFEDERYKGSTLQIMGATIENTSEWAIVGGTGEFAMARGVIERKTHVGITGGVMQELAINGYYFMKSNQLIITKIGPWGGNGKFKHAIQDKPERLVSVTIRHGWVVDGISFSYIDQAGQTKTTGQFGFGTGKETPIPLGSSEFVIQVSGTINRDGQLSSLKLVTNLDTYGPFGSKPEGSPFNAPIPKDNHCHAQYAVLYSRDSKVPLRIEEHIGDALQGGYHYNIPCTE